MWWTRIRKDLVREGDLRINCIIIFGLISGVAWPFRAVAACASSVEMHG